MDYQTLIEDLKKIILPVLEGDNVELVEFDLVKSRPRPTLRLLVDKKEGGINLQECAALNEAIGKALDESNIMQGGYILEVASPGLDRPLKTRNDFSRCVNRRVRLFLNEPIMGKQELEGVIDKVSEEALYINIEGKQEEILFFRVNKAKQIF